MNNISYAIDRIEENMHKFVLGGIVTGDVIYILFKLLF